MLIKLKYVFLKTEKVITMHNQDSPLYKVFIDQCVSNDPNCWALTVKKLLCDLGFSNKWSNFDPNVNFYLCYVSV